MLVGQIRVNVKFYKQNRKFMVVKHGGKILHESGLHNTQENALNSLQKLVESNGWKVENVGHY